MSSVQVHEVSSGRIMLVLPTAENHFQDTELCSEVSGLAFFKIHFLPFFSSRMWKSFLAFLLQTVLMYYRQAFGFVSCLLALLGPVWNCILLDTIDYKPCFLFLCNESEQAGS